MKTCEVRRRKYDTTSPSRARQSIRRSGQPSNGEVTPLLDPPLDDGTVTSPILDPTLPDVNLEISVTTKGKEKEREYSNGREKNNIEYPTSTMVADIRGIAPTLPDANLEARMTAKGNKKERRHSDRRHCTRYPALTPEDYAREIHTGSNKVATLDFIINNSRNPKRAALEANDKLIAAQTKAKILEEVYYHSEPVSRLAPLYIKTKTNIKPEPYSFATFPSLHSTFNARSRSSK